jgi:hypothetical protein
MYLLFLVAIGAIMAGLWWIARRSRRRGVASVMSAIDEIWHPTAHESHFEIEAQAGREVPLPSPDEKLKRGRRNP